MSELDCVQVRELGAELALGVLAGQERASAVAHVDRCPACREHVEQLTAAGDALRGLLPASEPPPGFETRVAAALSGHPLGAPPGRLRSGRTGPEPTGREPGSRERTGRGWRTAAAAAVVALLAGLGGWGLRAATEPVPAPPHTAPALLHGTLLSAGHDVGRAYAYPGSPGWVYMSVDLDHRAGWVGCVLVRRDGSTTNVGWFSLTNGYGSWGAPAPVDRRSVTGVRLVARGGAVLATARLG